MENDGVSLFSTNHPSPPGDNFLKRIWRRAVWMFFPPDVSPDSLETIKIENYGRELNEAELQGALEAIRDFKIGTSVFSRPTRMVIPGPVRQMLAAKGYDTPEKIEELINRMIADKHGK